MQVAYLADGIPGLIGSPVGGILSDKSAAKHPTKPEARLVYNTLIVLVTTPCGLLLYAWTMLKRTWSLSSPLWHSMRLAALLAYRGLSVS